MNASWASNLNLSLGHLSFGSTTLGPTISTLVPQGFGKLHPIHQSHQYHIFAKAIPRKYLCQCVSWILLGVKLHQLHLTVLHELFDSMVLDIDVLHPRMIDGVLCKQQCTLTVTVHPDNFLCEVHLQCQIFQP